MFKKCFSLVLVLVFAITAVPMVGLTETKAANWQDVLEYKKNDAGTGIVITGCSDEEIGALAIPAKIEGLPVVAIDSWAFSYCDSLTGITIPNSVTSIGEFVFDCCNSLKSITIPKSVKSIGKGAFRGCSSLVAINVDSGNLNYCNINGVVFNKAKTMLICYPGGKSGAYTIPNSVINIGGHAFSCCETLTSVTIPNSVTSIGECAFAFCDSITSVTISKSVTSIDWGVFRCCSLLLAINVDSGNLNYCSINGVLFNKVKTTLICYPGGKSGAYTIPNSVTNIDADAFEDCTLLTSVTIPNSVTNIGYAAFYECSSLKSVTIPGSVEYIRDNAFYCCSSLSSLTILDGVKSIGESAFHCCTSLKRVTIPNSVTSIGIGAFGFYNDEDVVEDFLIQCYADSAGYQYAIRCGLDYKIISDSTTVKVTGIQLNATSASIAIGATKQLTVTVSPSNATNKAVTWTSSKTSVATVSSKGVVTAKTIGKATITCKTKDGNKTATCVVTVIPKTPTGVKAASASHNSIKISWTAVSGATGYAVYRATSKTGTYNYLKSTTATSLTDTSRTTGTTYYYKVKAYKMVGETKYHSGYSAIVSAKVVPAVPASFTAAKVSSTSVKTTWKAVTGATGYEVWMATSSGGSYSKLTTTTKTTYTKTKLTKNRTYYFKVRAYKTVNDKKVYGAFTAIKSAKPY